MKRSSSRGIATLFVVALLSSVFMARLVDIQIIRAKELGRDSYLQRSKTHVIPGVRGNIVDAYNRTLAESLTQYRLVLSPSRVSDYWANGKKVIPSAAYQKISDVVPITPAEISDKVTNALRKNKNSQYLVIFDAIGVDKKGILEKENIPWLYFERVYKRIYPFGGVAGNLLGFLNIDQVPQAGLELSYDNCLSGHDGKEDYLASPDGVPIPGSNRVVQPAKHGGQLALTIDSDLQWYTQQILKQYSELESARWGMVAIVSVKTGKVLALADYPTVDPNNVGDTDAINRGARTFSDPYEPGSIFKPVTTSILLDAGGLTPSSRFRVPYNFRAPGDVDISDDERHADMDMTLTGILVASSNSGMSIASRSVDLAERYRYLRNFGFGASTGLRFPAQSEGLLGNYKLWDQQTRYASSFGQGISATILQLASAYQTIANGGVRRPLSMVTSCGDKPTESRKGTSGVFGRVVSQKSASATSNMLEMVYRHSWLHNLWRIPGYRICAKTGTAQVAAGNGKYGKSYIVSVAGYAPAEDPEFVVITSMYKTKQNTAAAVAPVFQKVMSHVLKKYRVLPSTTLPTELALR